MLPEHVHSSYSDLRVTLANMSGEICDDTSDEAMMQLDCACQRYLDARRHSRQSHMLAPLPFGEGDRQECDPDQPDPEVIQAARERRLASAGAA